MNVFDVLFGPWSRKVGGLVAIAFLGWFYVDRQTFNDQACEWGREQMQTVLDAQPTTTTVAPKAGEAAREPRAGIPRRVPEVCERFEQP